MNNPVILAIVILAAMLLVMYVFQQYIIIPMRIRHLEEKENLRLQKAELMAMFAEYSPDPILRFNEKGKIILANNEATKLFSIPESNGTKVSSLIPEVISLNFKSFIAEGSNIEFTSKINEYYYRFIITGIPEFSIGQIYGRDITHLVTKEKNLESALRSAEETTRLKQDFLARISHVIRSPLVAIQGYAELLASEFPENIDEEYKSMFFSMANSSKRLYRSIDLIINIAQLQSGRYDCIPEKIHLNKLIRKIYNEFKSVSIEKEIEFSINSNIEEGLILHYDKYALEQIFKQLVDNAFKFTCEGEVAINLYEKNGSVFVDIKDTGIGLPEEHLKSLLAPLSREDLGYFKRHEGTGLGLALVKGYADCNNATIKVESKPGIGSTFTVIFNKN